MEPKGPQGRYPEAREGGIGPSLIVGAITRPAALSDGAIINPSVVSGIEETVALAGTLLITGTFMWWARHLQLWIQHRAVVAMALLPAPLHCML